MTSDSYALFSVCKYFRDKIKGRISSDQFCALVGGMEQRTKVNVHFFKLVATDIKFKIPLKCRKCSIFRPSAANYSKHSCIPGNSFMLQTRNFSKLIITWFKTGNFHPNLMFSFQVLVNAVLLVAIWWISFPFN